MGSENILGTNRDDNSRGVLGQKFIATSAKIWDNVRCTCFGSNYTASPRFIIPTKHRAVIAQVRTNRTANECKLGMNYEVNQNQRETRQFLLTR